MAFILDAPAKGDRAKMDCPVRLNVGTESVEPVRWCGTIVQGVLAIGVENELTGHCLVAESPAAGEVPEVVKGVFAGVLHFEAVTRPAEPASEGIRATFRIHAASSFQNARSSFMRGLSRGLVMIFARVKSF